MKPLGLYFDKFKNSAVKEIQKRTKIADIIKRESGVDVTMENISFVSNGIRLKINSIEKNQVFIKKERIIKQILDSIPNLNIKDIS